MLRVSEARVEPAPLVYINVTPLLHPPSKQVYLLGNLATRHYHGVGEGHAYQQITPELKTVARRERRRSKAINVYMLLMHFF